VKEQKSGGRNTGQQLLNELEGLLQRPLEIFRDHPNLVAEVEADRGDGHKLRVLVAGRPIPLLHSQVIVLLQKRNSGK